MTISEAQEAVDKWIQEVGKRYFSPLTNMALLTEETGELARVIARTYGDQVAKEGDLRHPENSKEDMAEELADILWVVLCLANQTGIDLTSALEASLKKKYTRDRNRFAGN
ncbi:MAG: nucleotide pyrophosphohydrolase [Muribaculaceae bacterium]|nr:nucleotide pyrophosphohydrolase [Muribaculaceae bacterium]